MYPISLVMPCYNRGYDLLRALRAYDRQSGDAPFELIAVDDGSSDDTYTVLTSYRPTRYTLRAERLERNQGPAGARNHGVALVQSPLVLFVGDDILPSPHFVQQHIDAHQHYPEPEVSILGRVPWAPDVPQNTLMRHIDGPGAEQFSYYYLRHDQVYDYRHFYTANISLKTDLLRALPYWFDVEFPLAGFEDVELAYRLTRKGMRIVYRSNIVGYHYHYHTVWSFSRRQYNCGMMAWTLVRKQPATLKKVLYRQFARIGLAAAGTQARLSQTELAWLENQILQLASFYEWTPHQLLDQLYRGILEYFYLKGIIEGFTNNTSWKARAHSFHFRHYLLPKVRHFIAQAQEHHIALPRLGAHPLGIALSSS